MPFSVWNAFSVMQKHTQVKAQQYPSSGYYKTMNFNCQKFKKAGKALLIFIALCPPTLCVSKSQQCLKHSAEYDMGAVRR